MGGYLAWDDEGVDLGGDGLGPYCTIFMFIHVAFGCCWITLIIFSKMCNEQKYLLKKPLRPCHYPLN